MKRHPTLMGRDLTKIFDFSREEVELVLDRAASFQAAHQRGVRKTNILDGQVVAMVFEKPSLRTKVAFEVATVSLGGNPVFLSSSQILASGQNLRGRESVPDIARNLERFADLIVARVYQHEVIDCIADSIKLPVINALCDRHHPTQALADLMAIRSHFGPGKKVTVAFVGDGNNVATSLMQVCALCGLDFKLAAPDGYLIPQSEIRDAQIRAAESGALLTFVSDPKEAVAQADVVYTDTFTSMGQENEKNARDEAFRGYQVNQELLSFARLPLSLCIAFRLTGAKRSPTRLWIPRSQ